MDPAVPAGLGRVPAVVRMCPDPRFPNAGGGFNRQMPPFFSGQRFGDVRNHLPLRRTGNKVGDLFLKRLIPGGNLRFKRGG